MSSEISPRERPRQAAPAIEQQQDYYDGRYRDFEFANLLQLDRAVAILAALRQTNHLASSGPRSVRPREWLPQEVGE